MKAKHGIRDNEKEQIAKALDLDVQDVRIAINKMRF